MNNLEKEEALLVKRFLELSERSYNRGIFVYSDFLNMYEQDLVFSNINTPFSLFGGYENAERQLAIFGSEDDLGYAPAPPIICILISPLMQKFADDLTHRDFLGSVLGLGIKREAIGDIIIKENCGYIFCLESIATFITENLKKVRHTSVKCEIITDLPKEASSIEEEIEIVVASERLDAIIGAVFKLSRSESNLLFTSKKVFVNNKLTENNSHKIKNGDLISVRGFGRFKWLGEIRETKKGKLRSKVIIYK